MSKIINDIGRTCMGCQEFLEWKYFHKSISRPHGYKEKCKNCRKNKIPSHKPKVDNYGRECSKCKKYLSWSNFDKQSGNVRGYASSCRPCVKKNRQRYSKTLIKPLNPKTGKLYKRGEEVNGKYFVSYRHSSHHPLDYDGKYNLFTTISYDEYIKLLVHQRLKQRDKNVQYGVIESHNLTFNHLIDIFPRNMICPVLGIKMVFVAFQINSIELDRININKPYEDGNVAWISAKANRSKSDSSSKELYKIADWLKSHGL